MEGKTSAKISRRIILTLLYLSFTCFQKCESTSDSLSSSSDPSIVVIGAGASGIAAATKLVELGFHNVRIIEAENRIGGRIHTIPFRTNVVELGAQWCHGEKNNAVYEMAEKFNLFGRTLSEYNRLDTVWSNGTIVPTNVSNHLMETFQKLIKETKSGKGYPEGSSLGSVLKKSYTDFFAEPENTHIEHELATQFFKMYSAAECASVGCSDLMEVSIPGYFTYIESEGNQIIYWKERGYVTILDIMMKKYPEGGQSTNLLENRISLGKKAKEIIWDGRRDSKVLIKTEDGDDIEADHVIATMSLGVLQESHSKLFNPALPPEKARAIESWQLGTVDKMLIEFEKPFWPSNWEGYTLLWRENDELNFPKEKKWLLDVIAFHPFPPQPNVLFGWITGTSARYMETLPEEEVLEGVMFLLRKFMPWNVSDSISFKRTKWYSNPNFRGSYSFVPVKAEKAGVTAKDLSKPITQQAGGLPVLLFAGEATNDHSYSTVHGAIATGWREADRIASFYAKKNTTQPL